MLLVLPNPTAKNIVPKLHQLLIYLYPVLLSHAVFPNWAQNAQLWLELASQPPFPSWALLRWYIFSNYL